MQGAAQNAHPRSWGEEDSLFASSSRLILVPQMSSLTLGGFDFPAWRDLK